MFGISEVSTLPKAKTRFLEMCMKDEETIICKVFSFFPPLHKQECFVLTLVSEWSIRTSHKGTLIYNPLEERGEKNTYRCVSEQCSSEWCSKARCAAAGQTGISATWERQVIWGPRTFSETSELRFIVVVVAYFQGGGPPHFCPGNITIP